MILLDCYYKWDKIIMVFYLKNMVNFEENGFNIKLIIVKNYDF